MNLFQFFFSYDFLYIYDGDSIFADLLLNASGDDLPGPVESTQPEITILFQSDSSETEEGFKLEYRACKFVVHQILEERYLYLNMFLKIIWKWYY